MQTGSIHPHTKFRGQVYILKKKRATVIPLSSTTTDLSSTSEPLTLPALSLCPRALRMCMPGDNVEMDVELITPIAIEEGLRFAIREGGRTCRLRRCHQDQRIVFGFSNRRPIWGACFLCSVAVSLDVKKGRKSVTGGDCPHLRIWREAE